MQTIFTRSKVFVLGGLLLLGMVAPALGRPPMARMSNPGFGPAVPRNTSMPPLRITFISSTSPAGGIDSRMHAPFSTNRQNVLSASSSINTMLPAGTVVVPTSGTNMFLAGNNNNMNTTLSPTMQFMLLEQAATNATFSPDVTLSFMGISSMSSPFGMNPLLPPGLMSLFPGGMNVTLPTPQVNPLLMGTNPLLLSGELNPLLLSAELNNLSSLSAILGRDIVVSPRTSLLVSPSMLFLGSPGMNSVSLVGLSSLTAGGMTTPATLPFVVALNSDVVLSPNEEKEFQRKIQLVKSQTGVSPTAIWSATDLNVLLDDLKAHPDRGGQDVALSAEVIRHVNIIPSKSTANAGLLRNSPHWPELLQRAAFQEEKDQIERLIPELVRQAKAGAVKGADLEALEQKISAMGERLAGMIQDVPDPTYIRAKRFLVDLQSGIKVLRQPDAANYFSPMYGPESKSVRELVQHMSKNGLRFAPATAGDEAAYLAFYHALATYDVSANLQPAGVTTQVAVK